MDKAKNHRAYVGPKEKYDQAGKTQLRILIQMGLKSEHYFLDIGCGSLRAGKHIIPYLSSGHYYGIEPNKWLIDAGLEFELSKSVCESQKPTFDYNADFKLTVFGRKFDWLLAQSIFSHAAKWQIEKCFSEARKVMHKKSLFLATFEEGRSNRNSAGWRYPGLNIFTIETMKELADNAKLTCQKLDFKHWCDQTWILLKK